MLDQIEELLNAPTSGASAPSLERMEDTLTEGYAQALALEAERCRVERRLSEVVRTVGGADPDVSVVAEELTLLAKRLTRADGELTSLRARLGSLQERTRSMRRAARMVPLESTVGPSC
jgi:phage shock protein A